MDTEILESARRYLRQSSLRGALLSSPASVTWLTGYAAPVISGPNPFEGGNAVAWLDSDHVILLVADAEQGAAASTGAEVDTYLSYQIDSPLQPLRLQADAFNALLARLDVPTNARIGVESLPAHLWTVASARWPSATLVEIDGWTDRLRAVKTVSEIDRIRASCGLCSTAQATLRQVAASDQLAGKTEIEIFNMVLTAMEQQAGERLPVLADLVAGQRTAGIGGPPTRYVVQPGDPVLADIVPRLNGYWGDICNVHVQGTPSGEIKQYYAASREALYAAINAVRPGAKATDIDHVAREVIEKHGYPAYPHHTGHGIGVAWHEEPRICGYNDMLLEAGMIVALEPGVYIDGVGGVRLEHVVLVTASGAEILTNHMMEI